MNTQCSTKPKKGTHQSRNREGGREISLKPTEVPTNPVAKSTNTAELPVRGHRPGGCHSALSCPGLGDGKRCPYVASIRFVCIASFRAGLKIILHPLDTIQFLRACALLPLVNVPLILPNKLQLGLALVTVDQ